MAKPLTYLRKVPTQMRASATFDSIVEAAAHILRDEGPRGLTTNKVAVRAGVSIGSLYQYFPNKKAIVRALLEREIGRAERLRPATLDDERASAAEVMRAAVDWRFDLHRVDARYAQHLRDLAASLLPIEEQKRLATLRQERVGRTVARLIGKRPPEHTLRVAFIVDVCIQAVTVEAMRRYPHWLADDDFRAQVALLLVHALDKRN